MKRRLYREALGEVLKELRNREPMRFVAEYVPMSIGYLSEVENGHKELSSQMLNRIAEYYNVSTSSVIIETGLRLASWEMPNEVPKDFSERNGLRGGVLVR